MMNPPTVSLDDEIHAEGRPVLSFDALRALDADLKAMEMDAAEASLLKLIEMYGTGLGPLNGKSLFLRLWDLEGRVKDQLKSRYFIFLDASEANLYEAANPPFGREVEDQFGAAVGADISEASKCLGLGRTTACVFHLMRAMEGSLQLLASSIHLVDIKKAWGPLLSDIAGKIAEMPRGERRDAWSRSHSHLYHVKQAWRNDVMHPKATYTEEEAREVFAAVRSFMRHLAALK